MGGLCDARTLGKCPATACTLGISNSCTGDIWKVPIITSQIPQFIHILHAISEMLCAMNNITFLFNTETF